MLRHIHLLRHVLSLANMYCTISRILIDVKNIAAPAGASSLQSTTGIRGGEQSGDTSWHSCLVSPTAGSWHACGERATRGAHRCLRTADQRCARPGHTHTDTGVMPNTYWCSARRDTYKLLQRIVLDCAATSFL